MSVVDAVDIPFLRLSDPSFSIRSPEVREARERSWYARTPYGIAVLRYDDVGNLLRDPRLRQGSYAWPAHNRVTGKFADWWLRILLNRVGDDHARLRRLANPAFSPKLIIPLQPIFAELKQRFGDEAATFERGKEKLVWPATAAPESPAGTAWRSCRTLASAVGASSTTGRCAGLAASAALSPCLA